MGWLKRDLIKRAFGAIGLASSEFDVPAEQQIAALVTLDSMMAAWNADGIRLSYPIPSAAEGGSLDEDSKLPDRANLAVWANLAVLLASEIGRPVSVQLQAWATRGYAALLARAAASSIPEMQMERGTLAGAGNKSRSGVFLPDPTDTLDVGPDGEIDFE